MSKSKTQKNIPEEWQRKKLGELYNITSSKRVFQSEWKSQGVPFYRAREIVKLSEDGFVNNEIYISNKMYELYKTKYGVPKENDLLVTGVGTIGVLYRVKSNKKFYFKDGNIIWFKNKNFVSSKFIEQLFKTSVIKKQILGSSPITTVATYTIDTAKKTTVYLPPLTEQNRIATVLETWDKCLEKLSRKIEIKKNIKKGLMQKLLNGGVRLKGFSEEWNKVKLEDVCNIKKGEQLSRINLTEKGEYPALNGGIYPSGYTNKWNTKENTITISEGGNSCGYVNYNIKKFWCGGHCYALKDINKKIVQNYLYQLLKKLEKKIMSYRVGSGLPNIQKKSLENLKLNIPNTKEQEAIAEVLTTADQEIEVLEKKKKIIEAQKKYLLNNLITGKIRVPV